MARLGRDAFGAIHHAVVMYGCQIAASNVQAQTYSWVNEKEHPRNRLQACSSFNSDQRPPIKR